MPADTPFVVVNGPRFTPLGYGLLSAAQVVDDADPHWKIGTEFQPDACDADKTVAAFCVAGGPATGTGEKVPTITGAPMSAAEPFTVYAFHDCGVVGWGDDLEDLQKRAMRQLDAGEGRAVERVFWTGIPDGGPTVRPHLAEDTAVMATPSGAITKQLQSAATVLTTGAVDVLEAMSLLEGALASCYGGEGVIHVPAAAVPHLANHSLIRAQGPQFRTLLGNIVAAYSAGSLMGPTGADAGAGTAWLYATGAVMGRRSTPSPRGLVPARDFVGRDDNSSVYLVERTYVFDWDCCHLAAQATLVAP